MVGKARFQCDVKAQRACNESLRLKSLFFSVDDFTFYVSLKVRFQITETLTASSKQIPTLIKRPKENKTPDFLIKAFCKSLRIRDCKHCRLSSATQTTGSKNPQQHNNTTTSSDL